MYLFTYKEKVEQQDEINLAKASINRCLQSAHLFNVNGHIEYIDTIIFTSSKKKAGVFKVGARDLDYLILGAVEEALKLYDMETLDRAWGV